MSSMSLSTSLMRGTSRALRVEPAGTQGAHTAGTKPRNRMAAMARTVRPARTRPNRRPSIDFISDVTGAGRRFHMLAEVDDFIREVLAGRERLVGTWGQVVKSRILCNRVGAPRNLIRQLCG